MVTIPEAFAIAVQHHQCGRVQAAEPIYRQILAIQPDHADAIHLLGVIAHQAGKHELAVDSSHGSPSTPRVTMQPGYETTHDSSHFSHVLAFCLPLSHFFASPFFLAMNFDIASRRKESCVIFSPAYWQGCSDLLNYGCIGKSVVPI